MLAEELCDTDEEGQSSTGVLHHNTPASAMRHWGWLGAIIFLKFEIQGEI